MCPVQSFYSIYACLFFENSSLLVVHIMCYVSFTGSTDISWLVYFCNTQVRSLWVTGNSYVYRSLTYTPCTMQTEMLLCSLLNKSELLMAIVLLVFLLKCLWVLSELGSPDCCSLDLTSDLLCVIFPPNTDGALLAGNRVVSNPIRIICLLYKLLTVLKSFTTH